jgi:hypothetical protein
MITAHRDELPEPLAAVAGDQLALADAVAALRHYSLVRVVADGLLCTDFSRPCGPRQTAEQVWADCAVRLLGAAFPSPGSGIATWPERE